MDTPTPDEPSPFRPHRTITQWVILGVNVLVVLACLAGAAVLVYGKAKWDGTLAGNAIVYDTTPLHGPATTNSFTGATGPAPTDATGSTVPGTFPIADPQAQNFLITGSDANACVDPGSPWAGAADPARENIGNRSDTIMILRLNPATKQAAVLSFPRDLWIPIHGKGKNRINSAYVRGDSQLLAQTIYDNFGIKVDHWLQVDFCAFKRIVESVHGVAVPFDTPIVDPHVGLNLPAGCHVFGGDEALAYVRSRHLQWVDANGVAHEDRAADFGRISRQQDFLRRVLKAALNKGMFNPSVATALIDSLQHFIVRDPGLLAPNDILKFAGVLHDVDPASINTYQVQGSGTMISGNAVLLPDVGGANMKAILAIFRGVAPLAGAPAQALAAPNAAAVATATATTVASTPTTVAGPVQNVKADILPSKTITC